MKLFFRIKLFVISVLFSVNVFASPFGWISGKIDTFLKANRRWSVERSIKGDISPSNYSLGKISEAGKREALDIIGSGMENNLYFSLYSHLERNPDLAKLFDDTKGLRDPSLKKATETLVIALVAMKRYEDNWIALLWREGDRLIFSKLWDVEPARSVMAGYIRREQLTDDPDLLLKYWKERERAYPVDPPFLHVSLEDRLVYFIHSSMYEIRVSGLVSYPPEPKALVDRLWESPFGETILKASRDNRGFNEGIQSLIKFITDGIQAASQSAEENRIALLWRDVGAGYEFEATLRRGQLFEELIRQGDSYSDPLGYPGFLTETN